MRVIYQLNGLITPTKLNTWPAALEPEDIDMILDSLNFIHRLGVAKHYTLVTHAATEAIERAKSHPATIPVPYAITLFYE
jgi:hypothetical protein